MHEEVGPSDAPEDDPEEDDPEDDPDEDPVLDPAVPGRAVVGCTTPAAAVPDPGRAVVGTSDEALDLGAAVVVAVAAASARATASKTRAARAADIARSECFHGSRSSSNEPQSA